MMDSRVVLSLRNRPGIISPFLPTVLGATWFGTPNPCGAAVAFGHGFGVPNHVAPRVGSASREVNSDQFLGDFGNCWETTGHKEPPMNKKYVAAPRGLHADQDAEK